MKPDILDAGDYEDYNEEGEEIVRSKLDELFDTLNATDRFKTCPLCNLPMVCVEFCGMGQRYICQNSHLISVNELFLNT